MNQQKLEYWKKLAYQPFANILTKNYHNQDIYIPDGKTYTDGKNYFTLHHSKEWMYNIKEKLYKPIFHGMWGMNHYAMVDYNPEKYNEYVNILIDGIEKAKVYYKTIDDAHRYNQWETYLYLVQRALLNLEYFLINLDW